MTEKAATAAQIASATLDAAVTEAEREILPKLAAASGVSDKAVAEKIERAPRRGSWRNGT